MTADGDILFGRAGAVATIVINRPQALNALTLANYRQIGAALSQSEADPSVHAVLIRGAGGRAFCAGGDVRAIYEAGRGIAGDPELPAIFFREEYQVIRRVHRFAKPYIAVIDGITMGGGAGMSVNGAYRIGTERTLFAMPETAIGLFPDVGATRFLNLCPGQIGVYLALSGARLGAADMLYCGLATHIVAQAPIEALIAALAQTDFAPGREHEAVAAVLAAFAFDPGAAPLAELRPAIDRCFAADSIEAILALLEKEGAAGGPHAAWAAATRGGLMQKSPTSLKITLRQLTIGRFYDIETALALEYRMTQHAMRGHDFYEGVRAMLIDKDQRPRWRPASLEQVGEDVVGRYFTPIGERELRFS